MLNIIENPCYTTSTNEDIEIKPIAIGIYKRWLLEWLLRNPMPKPPKRAVVIVDTLIYEDDPDNQSYLIDLQMWTIEKDRAELNFIFSRGVTADMPNEWLPDPDTVSAKPDKNELKALWVLDRLLTEKDVEGLREAIISLNQVTEQGLEEAEKK